MDTDPDADEALRAIADHLTRYTKPDHRDALLSHLETHQPSHKLLAKVHQLLHQAEIDQLTAEAEDRPVPLPRRADAGRHRPRIPTRHGS